MYLLRLGLSLAKLSGRFALPTFAAALAGAVVAVGLLAVIGVVQVTAAQVDRLSAREPILGSETGPIVLHYSDVYESVTVERFVVADATRSSPTPPGLDRLPSAGEIFVSPALKGLADTRSEMMASLPGEIVGLVDDAGLRSPNELVAWIGVDLSGLDAQRASGFGATDQVPEFLAGGYRWFYILSGVMLVGVPMLVLVGLAARLGSRIRVKQVSTLRAVGLSASQIGLLFSIGIGLPTLAGAGLGTFLAPLVFQFVASEGSSWYSFFAEDATLGYLPRIGAIIAPVVVAVVVGWITIASVFRHPISTRPSVPYAAPSRTGSWLFALVAAVLVLLTLPIPISPPVALLLVFLASFGAAIGLGIGLNRTISAIGRIWARHAKWVLGLLTARQLQHASSGKSRLTTAVAIGLFIVLLLGPAQLLLGGNEAFETQVIQEQEAGGRSLIQVEVPMTVSLGELVDHGDVLGVHPIARVFDQRTGEPLGDSVLVASCSEIERIAIAVDLECPHEPFLVSSDPLADYQESVVVRDSLTKADIEITVGQGIDLGVPPDDNLEGLLVVQPERIPQYDTNGLQVGRYLIVLDIGASARDKVFASIRGLAPSANIIDAIEINVAGSQRFAPLLILLRVLAASGLFLLLCAASLAAADVLNERVTQLAALRRSGVPLRLLRLIQVASAFVAGVLGVVLATVFAIGVGVALRARLGLPLIDSLNEPLAFATLACVFWLAIALLSTWGLGPAVEVRQDRLG